MVTEAYPEELEVMVRTRPRGMGLPFSIWTYQRLADCLAEATDVRVSDETVRRHLADKGIVLSRPQHKISSPDPQYEVKKSRLKRSTTT